MNVLKQHYKFLIFILCLSGSLVAIYVQYCAYKKQVRVTDILFSKQKSFVVKTNLQIDSDVAHSVDRSVFFARDIPSGERYKVTTPPLLQFVFGDCIDVSGIVIIPEVNRKDYKDETSTLYRFPYREYLAKDNVYKLIRVKNTVYSRECIPLSHYQRIELFFMKQKERLTNILLREYEQPYAGLVAGVLVAGKGLMNKKTLDMFKRTSLSHVVVLSGTNVSIVILCVTKIIEILFFWKKEDNFYVECLQKGIVLICIWMFVLLTGGGAPIYRAAASAFVGMILFKDKTSQVYALTITVFVLTIINPFQTLYDPSFHLTCCATYGLILFSKPIQIWMHLHMTKILPRWLQEIVAVTLATQVFVFPYLVYMTGSFSSVFLLSNMLVLPMIPMIMFLGFLTLVGSVTGFELLLDVNVWVNNLLLKFVFGIVNTLSQVPYGYIQMKTSTSVFVLVSYSILLTIIIYYTSRRRPPSLC